MTTSVQPQVSGSRGPGDIPSPFDAFGRMRGYRNVLPFGELAVLIVSTPLLIYPSRFSPVALVLLPGAWLARLITRRRTLRRSIADWPLAGMLLMLSVSLVPSIDLTLSLPRLYGLLLAIFVFSFVVEHGPAAPGPAA